MLERAHLRLSEELVLASDLPDQQLARTLVRGDDVVAHLHLVNDPVELTRGGVQAARGVLWSFSCQCLADPVAFGA